jgi:pimeloyl-ACP methyl ester carboxylesterase
MSQSQTLTEHRVETSRHRTAYLAAGPEEGPLVVLVHGWPELGRSWRKQLPLLGALGFRAVAPDMRGYGGSSVPAEVAAYGQRQIVADMIELIDGLGRERAIWVGHDWGAPVVWGIAGHHPERCRAVAALSVPYFTLERGLQPLLDLVDRQLYPAVRFPAGQWDYMLHYEESFEAATATFDADPLNTVKALFRGGEPERAGKRAYTATIREHGGWFGGRGEAPELPLDRSVLDEEEAGIYAAALARNGFAGPDSWYMNHEANAAFAAEEVNGGRIEMPVLFMAGAYEYTCECTTSRLAQPMGERCADLTAVTIPAGHWMALERPAEVNAALVGWLANRVGALAPKPGLPPLRV